MSYDAISMLTSSYFVLLCGVFVLQKKKKILAVALLEFLVSH